jgi:Ca-activated chloride channel family protein
VRLELRRHLVETSIVDGVAVTQIDQTFFNQHDRIVEGTYVFPLEDDIALSRFSMYVDGVEIEGKLLGVEEARREYERIVASMRDPALLEYLGTRMFRARIFPINPKAEVRIKLSYTQMLENDDGLVWYRYPLGTERHPGAPVGTISVLTRIQSAVPIKSVFSPSHHVAVNRTTDYKATASFEAQNTYPEKDFELFYALGEKEFGLTVLTYREPGDEGFFLLRIAPPAQTSAADALPKDISFVMDTSGSMAGEKMDQARTALRFCLSNLNPEDRFNVIPFSHEATQFRDTLVPADAENVKAAREFAGGLQAIGGTNINDALLAALDSAPPTETARPYLIVFLTDGLPTIGMTHTKEILKNIAQRNDGRVRLYVFGVGYDVNTHLLDLLAEQNRGARDYVEPGENLELRLSSFYRKIAQPVLTDLALSFGGLAVHDVFPPKLTDLFGGTELVVTGRYRDVGHKAVELTGVRRGRRERFVYETTFPSDDRRHDFLPQLWATRKVGYLLDQIRLHGEDRELKDTIVQLATKYGIVTPYTAYLVTEPGSVASRGGGRDTLAFRTFADAFDGDADHEEFHDMVAAAPGGGVVRGPDTVARKKARVRASRVGQAMKMAEVPAAELEDLVKRLREESGGRNEAGGDDGRAQRVVERVGSRTLYRVGERWIDAEYEADRKTTKIEAFSEGYFDLVRKHPELAGCFALGERVVVVLGGQAYETVPPPEE